MAKILLVDDDLEFCNKLSEWLSKQNFTVDTAANGEDAIQLAQSFQFDIIVLDWQMPGVSGLDVCRILRAKNIRTPILFLTGMGEYSQKELGLDTGADDYLVKPFDLGEFGARLRALLRRPQTLLQANLSFEDLSLDTAFNTVSSNGQTLKLTVRECSLLAFLMRHSGQPFSARELRDSVWPSDGSASDEAVRTCIKTLRQKLKQLGKDAYINRDVGCGYVLRAP